MHIKDYATAQGWFRKHAAAPSSKGAWKAFVARNKMAQEPRTMMAKYIPRHERDNFNTPDLEQTPDSVLKPGETLEDFDVNFRRPNAHGGRIGLQGGQLVQNTVDGLRPGYKGLPSTNPYLQDKDFLKFVKKEYDWTPKQGGSVKDMVVAYERTLAKKNKVIGAEGLIKILGGDNPYSLDTINRAFGSQADMTIKKNMSSAQKSKIKMAQKIRKILIDNIGESKTMKEVYAPFKYLSQDYKKVPGSITRVWEINKKQIKALNKALNKNYAVYGMRENTIDNIYKLFDDKKFMNQIKKYAGGEVDIDSYMFKKVFKPGAGQAHAYMQLGLILQGKIEMEGIKVDKALGNKIVKSIAHDSAMNIDGEMGKAAQRYAKFHMAKFFDNPNATYKNISESITKAFRDAGVPVDSNGKLKMNLDEVFPTRTGQLTFGKGSGVYNQFVQFIDAEINQKTKRSFDGRMSGRLTELEKQYKLAKKSGDYSKVETILGQHNDDITNTFKKNPEMKGKVNLTQFQWDAKNKKFLDPKQVFESQYKGSYRTIPEKIRKGMEKFYEKTKISIDPGTARTLEAAHKEIKSLDKKGIHKFLKEAGFNINKCLSEGGRVKLKSGKGVNTCIAGVIDEEMKLAKKSGNMAKFTRFGKAARIAGYLFGWVDIPIELAFALPHLLAGNVQDAKAATTLGLLGYGGKKLEQIDQEKNPEAYKYFKHIEDINNWMDAFNQQQDAQSKWDNVDEEYLNKYEKEGDPSGVMDSIVDQYDEAVATQKFISTNYQGYVNEEGEEDLRLLDLGKEEGKKYLREIIEEEWKEGMPIKVDFTGVSYNEPFNNKPYHFTPYKEDKITSLEQQIKQKGESFYGGFMKPGVKAAAERLGAPDLYDDWYDAYYGKDPREAYSSLPLEWTGQLAELEKKELYQALSDKLMRPGGAELKKSLIEQGFDFEPFREYNLQTTGSWRMSEGGIASLRKKKW